MMITNFDDVNRILDQFVGGSNGLYTIEMTQKLADFVGNPERNLEVVHVAGTSGKTSTCYYIRELIEAAGQKTGLTVSPHIISIADRVQVGGGPLSEEVFCKYFDEFYSLIRNFSGRPSYFEVMMVFAFWVFVKENVDYAVIETGLGGLHDSSNICRRPDKLCVLTDIGFDHMNVLGNSLEEITRQKIGIVAPGNTLITYRKPPGLSEIIEANAKDVVYIENIATHDYRERNFHLSLEAFRYLMKRDGLAELSPEQIKQASLIQVPGRLEKFNYLGKLIVLDGAHNQQKMEALIDTFRHQFPQVKPIVVLAMKKGKEYQEVISQLKPLATEIIVSQFETLQDTHMGAIDTKILLEECQRQNIPAKMSQNLDDALEIAEKNGRSPVVLVTGSLYAVSEVRQMVKY